MSGWQSSRNVRGDFEIELKTLDTDVLVVGSEAGGGRAAIEAADCGAEVILATKSIMAKSGNTVKATFSCNAALGLADQRDNPSEHFKDTVVGGRYINNQKLVDIFTSQAPERVEELGKWGMKWDTDNGRYRQTKLYGHSYPRSLSVGFRVGQEMTRVLRLQVKQRPCVRLLSDFFVTTYVRSEAGPVAGATAIDVKSGEFVFIKAKAIIDATGGGTHMYRINSGTPETTADGMAMASRIGAELIDMEFVQFVLAMVNPVSLRGYGALAAFAKSWIRGKLYNVMGERFMRVYAPDRMELADRDVLCRAIFNEIREGRGTPGGAVWLDCSFLADTIIETRIQQLAPNWVFRGLNLLDYGLDLRRVPLEVGPSAHFFCGGLRVDGNFETSVEGLFGAGECVGGPSGANRLPGNALAECLVGGVIAGRKSAERAKSVDYAAIDRSLLIKEHERVHRVLSRREGVRPFEIKKRLQDVMWEKAGVIRDESGLRAAISEIERMRVEDLPRLALALPGKVYNREWIEGLELENMLDVARIVATAALFRTETRGNNWRADYPQSSSSWLKNNVVRVSEGKIDIESVPVVATKLKLEG